MLDRNDIKMDQLVKSKAEALEVIGLVSEMNHNLKKKVIIPVQDNLAYFIGEIKNTNVCKVYLGEDYFVETTNYRAIKILNSKLDRIDNLIEKCKTEKIDKRVEVERIKKLEDDTIEIKEGISDEDYIKMKNNKVEQEIPNLDLLEKMNKITELRQSQVNKDEEVVIRRKQKDIVDIGLNIVANQTEYTKPSLFLLYDDEF